MSVVLDIMGRADCVGAGLKTELLARAYGWSQTAAGEAKLLVIELCSNAQRYGRGGTCALHFDAACFEVTVEDKGPGLPRWVLEGGQHEGRRGGLGAGLECARRFSDELILTNSPGGGARVVARRRRRGPQSSERA